jgi:gamma-glutamyl-gamma-aminobutyrate hydrolase PuuD
LRNLGKNLVVEARSIPDGVIEAVRYAPPQESKQDPKPPFALGVQWHPEFMVKGVPGTVDPDILLQAFLGEIASREKEGVKS